MDDSIIGKDEKFANYKSWKDALKKEGKPECHKSTAKWTKSILYDFYAVDPVLSGVLELLLQCCGHCSPRPRC